MTLNHSTTWPVNTFAVVQLRVDLQGRTYSSLAARPPHDSAKSGVLPADDISCNNASSKQCAAIADDGVDVVPLSKKHLELFTKMSGERRRTTVRTDTVSTILDQDVEFEAHEEPPEEEQDSPLPAFNGTAALNLEKFHVLALTRIEECHTTPPPQTGGVHGFGRRPSNKVDNWDFIYTETKPMSRCPVHRCLTVDVPSAANGVAPPKAKSDAPADLPLDARKTTTLRRHYYLEGGWGWVIVVCAVLVHVLNHGVQLSCSQLVLPGADKFKVEAVHFAAFC